MKKIKLDGVEYEVCTSWRDVTIGKQIQVSIDKDKQETDVLKRIAILSGYSNIPLQILRRTNISDLTELFKEMSFINTVIPEEPIDKFEFKGETYYIGQNLMEQEFQDYISLQNILERFKDNSYMGVPYIMAIMSKRLKEDGTLESLDDYDPEERAKQFHDVNISIANGIAGFFLKSTGVLSNFFQLYSNPKEIVETKMEEVKNILKKQDGQGLLTRCVNGILLKYIKYIKRKSDKLFTS